MAQLWGGRFTKETDKLVYNFNASISFDKKFYEEDIEGSIAHVTMLAAVGILTETERDDIISTLKEIKSEVDFSSVPPMLLGKKGLSACLHLWVLFTLHYLLLSNALEHSLKNILY